MGEFVCVLHSTKLIMCKKIWDVFSFSSLKYCGSVISLNGDVPSLDKIDHCFGATHPGVYDSVNQVFELKFRGLQFQFPADPGLVAAQMSGLGAVQFEELPLVGSNLKMVIAIIFFFKAIIIK